MSQDELCALLIVVQGDLENPAREGATFALLRAVIVRRLIAPEVYDIAEQVSKMLVRSGKATTRQRCSSVLLQFLLRYPLGPERLQQHLEHFVKNLQYAYADGRLAVLDMLHAVVLKFPKEELLKQVREPRSWLAACLCMRVCVRACVRVCMATNSNGDVSAVHRPSSCSFHWSRVRSVTLT
jgi:hypothetical protein